MARRRASHHAAETEDRNAPTETVEHAEGNSPASGTAGNGVQAAAGAHRPAMERAEELADRIASKIGHYASVVGYTLLRWASRAREEAEDIWAEAQNLRHRWQQPKEPPQQGTAG
jgi:hypothetical protein